MVESPILNIRLLAAQWPHMVTQIRDNIGSDNGLLPFDPKPLPDPVLASR